MLVVVFMEDVFVRKDFLVICFGFEQFLHEEIKFQIVCFYTNIINIPIFAIHNNPSVKK